MITQLRQPWCSNKHISDMTQNQSINQTRQFLTRRNTAKPLQGRKLQLPVAATQINSIKGH